jgi:hypothetical protein
VRYCVFQGERLDFMRPYAIEPGKVDKFNALINYYNNRCSSFSYSSGVLQLIEREVPSQSEALRAAAQRIAASW